MGDSISEGTVQSFVKRKYLSRASFIYFNEQLIINNFVEVGEYVEADEVVAVIETDKVNVDIRSTHSGVITKYFANEGETVAVDSQFLEIDTDAKGGASGDSKPKVQEAKKDDKP